MRQAKWVLLAVVALVPQAQAQRTERDRPGRVDRGERRVDRLMDQLREEMWDYRRELNFFQRAPEYNRLVDLRYEVRGLAMRVAELERAGGPRARAQQRELARRMEERARDLKRLTGQLERRTDLGAPVEVRRHADRLKGRADRIRDIIGRLRDVVR